MASSLGSNPPSGPFTINFECHKCGEKGFSVWEESATTDVEGEKVLVGLSKGFFERLNAKCPYEIELVCRRCETVQKGNERNA